jgi:PAS domain S-box-containing protein
VDNQSSEHRSNLPVPAESLLAQVIDLADDAIISIDSSCRILLFNQGASQIFGYSSAEMIGQPLDRLIPPRSIQRHRDDVAEFTRSNATARRKADRAPVRGLRKDGSEFPAEASISRVNSENGPLLTVTLRDISSRVAADTQIQDSIREKDALLREIHHRVKNNLQVMSSLLGLQSRTLAESQARQALEDSQGRIHSMALIHELMCRSPEFSGIDTADYIRQLIDYRVRAQGPEAQGIRVATDLEKITVDLDSAVPFGLIFNELMTNTLRHAFPDSRAGEIRISLCRVPDHRAQLTVEDDGVGLPAGFDWRSATSLGFRLIRMLSDQLKATIDVHPNGPTTIQLTFATTESNAIRLGSSA